MGIGIVNTRFGKIRGVELTGAYEGITEFRGIPYAKPPVGNLRWRAPEDPESWNSVKVCDTYPDMAYQITSYSDHATTRVSDVEHYWEGLPPMSEDCLYMNICTPAQHAGEKLPVLMWYHGGGLTSGYNHELQDDPCELAKRGIIVVNIAHRLGPFGYLSLPQLSEEQGGKSGNYGLMDQVKALDWITENIEQFGGDPDNISAGGVSGGTWKAAAIAVSPRSHGRVKHIFAQSVFRAYIRFATLETAEQQGREYLENAGFNPDTVTLDELRALPPEKIWFQEIPRDFVIGDMYWDHDFIPYETSLEAFEKCPWRVDVLSSTTCGESDVMQGKTDDPYYYAHYKVANGAGFDSKEKIESTADFYRHFRCLLGDLYNKYDFENLVKVSDEEAWTKARELASYGLVNPGKGGGARTLMKHRILGMHLGKLHPENRYFTYLFTHILPVEEKYLGTILDPKTLMAFHGSDGWFTFNSLREGRPPHRPWREEDFALGRTMCDYLANFFKTGDPNGEGLPAWPEASENYGWLDAGDVPVGHTGIENRLDELIHEFVGKNYRLSE